MHCALFYNRFLQPLASLYNEARLTWASLFSILSILYWIQLLDIHLLNYVALPVRFGFEFNGGKKKKKRPTKQYPRSLEYK